MLLDFNGVHDGYILKVKSGDFPQTSFECISYSGILIKFKILSKNGFTSKKDQKII